MKGKLIVSIVLAFGLMFAGSDMLSGQNQKKATKGKQQKEQQYQTPGEKKMNDKSGYDQPGGLREMQDSLYKQAYPDQEQYPNQNEGYDPMYDPTNDSIFKRGHDRMNDTLNNMRDYNDSIINQREQKMGDTLDRYYDNMKDSSYMKNQHKSGKMKDMRDEYKKDKRHDKKYDRKHNKKDKDMILKEDKDDKDYK